MIAQFEDSPVTIRNNTEFVNQGWLGNGTPSSPYRLENLRIYDDDNAIYISNTNACFIIRNCTVQFPALTNGDAIRLINVTNGIIMNCTIVTIGYDYGSSYDLYGIHIYYSSNTRVTDCTFSGYAYGIQLSYCARCFVGYSTFTDQRYIGIGLALCNDTTVADNTLIGRGRSQSLDAIYIRVNCSNCSAVSNTVNNYIGGIRTQLVVGGFIDGNIVTNTSEGILIQGTNLTRIGYNLLTDNRWGVLIGGNSHENLIVNNILGDNRINAEDRGEDNSWVSNWYSDYSGLGVYVIPGSAYSTDASPLPQTLHFALIINAWASLSLIGVLLLGAAIGYHMRFRERHGGKVDKGPSLFFMVLSVLLPCGFSVSPSSNSLFPNLKYVVSDVLFTLGISRSPGTDWIVNYYSSSIVSANDQLLLVAVPYLVASILSIILLLGYLRKDMGGKLFGLGIFMIILVVMPIPLMVSMFLLPITPLLALSIAFWARMLKSEGDEINSTDNTAVP